MPGPTFGFVKLLASSGSHCTKWADEQHRPVGFESRLVPDHPLPFTPTLIGLRAFDRVSSRVWWEAATNKQRSTRTLLGAARLHEARILHYRGCIHLTATSSSRFNTFFFLYKSPCSHQIQLCVLSRTTLFGGRDILLLYKGQSPSIYSSSRQLGTGIVKSR